MSSSGLMAGKVAVVTGAGRGIGRGEALELAAEGASVVVGEVDEAAGQSVVNEIVGAGGSAVLQLGDASEIGTAQGVVARALDEYGQLDAVVNNAGILRDRTLVKMTPDEWDAVIKVHLRGTYALTHAACNYFKSESRTGHIVCTSSTSGILGAFGQSNYGAAKAGIAAFSTIVAQEMAKYGVTCNAIAPAARTRMTVGAFGEIPVADGDFDFWSPDNVAPFVTFLCSDASSHISGKVFGVQGDAIELYRPYTSVAVIENGGSRWAPGQFSGVVGGLFDEAGMVPGAENMSEKIRYKITD